MQNPVIAHQVQQFAPLATDRPCCLIVEDQVLIALSIEAYLEEVGYDAAGPFVSCSDALDWLKCNKPQAAILDYKLKDGACTVLAQELLRCGIPFMVYSGHPRRHDTPLEFTDAPWVEKPCVRDDILAMAQLLTRRR
jgi:DNA-binding response OmpR family regulator